jgi:hypothetical protein
VKSVFRHTLLTIGVLAAFLALAGCSAGAPATSAPEAVPASATSAPTDLPQPTATLPEPTVPPTEAPPPTEALASGDACVDCHSDKDQLIDTADPEAEVISENKGAG